jgi:hypothetical protein
MREIFTYGSVGGALGNQCFYLEVHSAATQLHRTPETRRLLFAALYDDKYQNHEVEINGGNFYLQVCLT